MRIAQINSQLGGSTGTLMCLLSDAMRQEGIENRMFFTFGKTTEADAYCYSSAKEIKINALKSRISGRYGFQSQAATKRLLAMLEAYRPDLVHIHNIHGHDVDVSMLYEYLGKKNIPVVHTLHDCWEFTGYCPHYTYARCEKWKTGCHDCPLRKRYSWFVDRSAQNYEAKKKAGALIPNLTLAMPSHWMEQQVRMSFLKDRNCVVIPNGIDTDVFHPCGREMKKELGIEDQKMVLAVAMSISSRKGSQDLVELAKLLPKDAVLVLVGLAEKERDLFPESVIVRPRTKNQGELAKYYSAADVLVNPTHEDNFPTVNLEAQACGTPVVTYEVGGSSESLTKETGVVVPENQIDLLCKAVLEAAEEKDQRMEACRQNILQNYSRKLFTKRYLDLYNAIVLEREV
jgi:putative colanic acid biosynthesis glycosyltransferase